MSVRKGRLRRSKIINNGRSRIIPPFGFPVITNGGTDSMSGSAVIMATLRIGTVIGWRPLTRTIKVGTRTTPAIGPTKDLYDYNR